jgi:type I protein arginine methyltransferase
MGSLLFNETMVKKYFRAEKRLLKGTGKIFPGKFELFLEPVCLKREYRVPCIWENYTRCRFPVLKKIEPKPFRQLDG